MKVVLRAHLFCNSGEGVKLTSNLMVKSVTISQHANIGTQADILLRRGTLILSIRNFGPPASTTLHKTNQPRNAKLGNPAFEALLTVPREPP